MEAHSRLMLGRGFNTQSTVNLAASEPTSSLTECHETKRSKSWELLPWLCAKGDFQDLVMLPWLKAQSAVPSTLLLQPSRRTLGKTQNEIQNIRGLTSIAATKIIQERQYKRKTAKSIASLLHLPNPCLKSHRTPISDGRTRGSCLLLGNALL
jgi:hypothetical protein